MTNIVQHLSDLKQQIDLLEDANLEESTLTRLVGKDAAGQNLARYLHRYHKLNNTADLEPLPVTARGGWTEMLSHADNILIMQGDNGWAFYKTLPEEQWIHNTPDPINRGMRSQDSPSTIRAEFYVALNTGRVLTAQEIMQDIAKLEKSPDARDLTRKVTTSGDRTDNFYHRAILRGGRKANEKDARNPENMYDIVRSMIGPKIINQWRAMRREHLGRYSDIESKTRDQIIQRLGIDMTRHVWGSDKQKILDRFNAEHGENFNIDQLDEILYTDPRVKQIADELNIQLFHKPSELAPFQIKKIQQELDRQGISLGGGRAGREVFGKSGASIETNKINQRRPIFKPSELDQLKDRFIPVAETILTHMRAKINRDYSGVDKVDKLLLLDRFGRLVTEKDNPIWDDIWRRASAMIVDPADGNSRYPTPEDLYAKLTSRDPDTMRAFIRAINQSTIKRAQLFGLAL